MPKEYKHIETKLVHEGEPDPRIQGAVSLPVFQSSTFEYSGEVARHEDLRYIRLNNTPNHVVLHKKLAALEGGEGALVASSGMAAITTALFAVLSAGDHLLVQDCLYGGTFDFVTKDFSDFGIEFDFIPGDDPGAWEDKVRPNTKAVYMESITNPLLQVADLKAVAAFAKKHNLISLIDNTFASPVNFRPLEWGFDVSLHSGTKYLNGHTDIVAGVVISSASLIEKILYRLNHLGGSLDPHACFLLNRGLKTLALRIRCQNENALGLAKFLDSHEAVEKVYYPGLESHPGHDRARELFEGFGGMLGFEVKGGLDAAKKFIEKTTIPIIAPSLGGVETLITRPATTSHVGLTPEERMKLGISDALIRVSVGIENAEDLLKDFDQALNRLK